MCVASSTMDFNFTGSSRPKRTINLGRQPGPKSVADVAAQVRAQREDRRMHKVRVAARLASRLHIVNIPPAKRFVNSAHKNLIIY